MKRKKEERLGCISDEAMVSCSVSTVQAHGHNEYLKRCSRSPVMEAEIN